MARHSLLATSAALVALAACSGGGGGATSPGALLVVTSSLPAGQVSSPYLASLTASGSVAPYSWAVTNGTLPAGLSLSASGFISGTPTTAGTSSFVVTVTDSATPPGAASATLSIAVQAAGSSASPLSVTTSSLPGGMVGTSYSAQLAASGGTTPYTWALGAGSSLPPGLTLSSAGAISGTPTVAGSYGFTVVAVDASSPQQSASAALSIAVASPAGTLAVTTATLARGTVGAPYSQQLTATGGKMPYSWSVATGQLPTGLDLSTGGLLGGTPTTAGSFTFTVQVTDSSTTPQVAQATFTVTIDSNPAQVVTITTGSLPVGAVGHSYLAVLQAAGGTIPYTWTLLAGSLPDGLALSTSGTISGTPTAAGSFAFTVEVADSSTPTAQTATKQLGITVAP